MVLDKKRSRWHSSATHSRLMRPAFTRPSRPSRQTSSSGTVRSPSSSTFASRAPDIYRPQWDGARLEPANRSGLSSPRAELTVFGLHAASAGTPRGALSANAPARRLRNGESKPARRPSYRARPSAEPCVRSSEAPTRRLPWVLGFVSTSRKKTSTLYGLAEVLHDGQPSAFAECGESDHSHASASGRATRPRLLSSDQPASSRC